MGYRYVNIMMSVIVQINIMHIYMVPHLDFTQKLFRHDTFKGSSFFAGKNL